MISAQVAMALERQSLSDKQRELALSSEKERTRSNLLRAISHDLRTPLTGILGASSAILENEQILDKPSRDRLLLNIQDDSSWLIRMVENLLSVTSISEGAASIVKILEAAEEISAESVNRIHHRFPNRKISVKVPDELLLVPMDGILIEQVIINLLENAIKHSPDDSVIEIYIKKKENSALFEVIDNGKGISLEDIPRIFDGYMEKNKIFDSSRGIGIGLSICKSIIDAHGGNIWGIIKNQEVRCLAFRCHFQEMKAMKNDPVILLVEDDEAISNFISTILTANNYQVIKAKSAKEGLSLTAAHVPDLVLLDLGLPDMDGVQVLKSLRIWTKLPIIVVSARGHEREKVEVLDLGADDYITKPFGTAELLARIRTALRHSNANNKNEADSKTFSIGDLSIDYDKRIIRLAGKGVHLTPIEYKILVLLSKHAGKVLTHDFIGKEVWGPYANENQALRVNMANIRRKIEINPAEPRYKLTEIGVGYRMIEELLKEL